MKAAALLLALALLTGCGGGGIETVETDEADCGVHAASPSTSAINVVDQHICTDELAEALQYLETGHEGHAVLQQWDGTPFVVNVSSEIHGAERLIDMVRSEAEWIDAILGYPIIMAGEVLDDMRRTSRRDLSQPHIARMMLPKVGTIEIRCCGGPVAYPWWRVILFGSGDEETAVYGLAHELYHVLGFVHPGHSRGGVPMSHELMYGEGIDTAGGHLPTTPMPEDLARLACLYD